MYRNDFQIKEKRDWLITYPGIAKSFISAFYPLNSTMLETYGSDLDWHNVTINQNIPWTLSDIAKFKEKLFVGGEDYQLEWDDFVIECSDNPTMPWSEELIKLFNNNFYWEWLAMNPVFVEDDTLVKRYIPPDLLYLVEKARSGENEDGDTISPFDLSSEYAVIRRIPPRVALLPLKEWDIEFISQNAGFINWPALSSCQRLNWNYEIIETFLERLTSHSLYQNRAIRFDLRLLKLLSTHPDFKNEPPVTKRIWDEVFFDLGDREVNEILGEPINYPYL
jgi:hypothetical protein